MKVLIIWGGWNGHNPDSVANYIKEELEMKGHKVKSTCDFSILINVDLQQYDVIVPIWSCGIKGETYLNILLDAIKKGVGLATFHGGISWFEEEKYYEMIGGLYLDDAPYDEYHIEISNHNSIITENLDGFTGSGEIFHTQCDTSNNILATVRTTDFIRPYAWTKNYGKGKIFYSMGAHNMDQLFCKPCMDLILNGIIWSGKDD